MYRTLFPLLLCLNVATSAPQSKSDSDVTFVKIQPVLDDTAPEVTNKRRDSRIENLPLTIPGNISDGSQTHDKVSDSNPIDDSSVSTGNPTDDTVSDDNVTDDKASDSNLTDDTLPDLSVQNTEVSEQKTDLADTEVESENRSDIIPQETQSRQGRNYHSSDETTESLEIATEKYEDVTEKQPKTPLKFSPKLSYFPKNYDRFSTNLIEKPGKRRFKSRCRCEKIWNCQKLQISVGRCPDEYFLCCF